MQREGEASTSLYPIVINHRVRGVAGRVNDLEAAGAVSQADLISVTQRSDIPDHFLQPDLLIPGRAPKIEFLLFD